MKRLTSNTPLTEVEAMNLSLTNLYARLKEYEDTGLEPEEVRPVVLCRDCIYDNCFAQSILEEMSRIPFDKNRFFCADGKRRDGGTDK